MKHNKKTMEKNDIKAQKEADQFLKEHKRMASMIGTAMELGQNELSDELIKQQKQHLLTYMYSRQNGVVEG